jgi:hypothetical protein
MKKWDDVEEMLMAMKVTANEYGHDTQTTVLFTHCVLASCSTAFYSPQCADHTDLTGWVMFSTQTVS